jgi:hypothetical protein
MFFTRGGNGWSSSSTSEANRRPSLREIDKEAEATSEPMEDDGSRRKLYVAVGKDLKDSRSNLLCAARNLLPEISSLSCYTPTSLPREL